MSRRSTPSTGGRSSERLLLFALLALGILGLAITLMGRESEGRTLSASDSPTSSSGKVQGDRMILHLDEKQEVKETEPKSSRF